ncbi:MAG: type II toxin-antitoxin system MqsA family antitoxin [Deltaproteobacteria bacterium]|nr:type II toxin-antitoxin system MqsA family antitoxin [Deltaproteobacteria bacterium]
MQCVVCKKGETRQGMTTVTLERGGMTLVVKGVPAQVCANCGEAFVDSDAATKLLQSAEAAAKAGVQVDIREYIAA